MMTLTSVAYRDADDGAMYVYARREGRASHKQSDEFINGAYLDEVRQLALLTPEQEIQYAKAIEPIIRVRERIEKIRTRLIKRRNNYREPDFCIREKLYTELACCEAEESAILATAEFQEARNALMVHNLRWVFKIANKFKDKGMSFKDIIQEGNIGLLKAAERYDWRRGFRFTTYATWWIHQTIARAMEGYALVHVPSYITELFPSVKASQEAFILQYGHEPTYEELAQRCGTTVERVKNVLTSGNKVISMESPAHDDDSDASLYNLYSDGGDSAYDITLLRQQKKILQDIMRDCLTPAEREILERTLGLNGRIRQTLYAVGKIKHLSHERIRQIRNAALDKLDLPDGMDLGLDRQT